MSDEVEHHTIEIGDEQGNLIVVIDGELADDIVQQAVTGFIHDALQSMVDERLGTEASSSAAFDDSDEDE